MAGALERSSGSVRRKGESLRKQGRCCSTSESMRMTERTAATTSEAQLGEEGREMADNVLNALLDRDVNDFERLVAVSSSWPEVGGTVLTRLKERIQNGESLWWAYDELCKADERAARNRELLHEVQQCAEGELEALVASRRNEFDESFFTHVAWLVVARSDNGDDNADALAKLQSQLLSLCEAYDQTEAESESMNEAAGKLQELLSADTVEDMDNKVDAMASEGRIDQATMLSAAKMYNSVKQSEYTRDEVKEVMAHLYFKMQETQHRQQPPIVRILKFLVSIEDPSERQTQMEAAFTPGAELETEKEDYLHCQPQDMLQVVQQVLDAYRKQRGNMSMAGEAAELMDPSVIQRLEEIESTIQQQFM